MLANSKYKNQDAFQYHFPKFPVLVETVVQSSKKAMVCVLGKEIYAGYQPTVADSLFLILITATVS